MEITTHTFGTVDGQEVIEYTLTNGNGVSLSAIPYGATVTKIVTPDKEGNRENITLNVETLEDMLEHRPFYGATIGRIAGRITKGQFSLDGKDYQIEQNEGDNMLHGGPKGLDTKLWDVEVNTSTDEASLTFSYESAAGENGFPGNLSLKVVYILTDKNEWKIDYMAQTDEPTLFNPTNHIYFNLTGDIKQTILDHEVELASTLYATLNEEKLPTGNLENVEGTDFEFTQRKPFKGAILSEHEQIQPIAGLDHPFVLDQKTKEPKGKVVDPKSGRSLTFTTDQNSVVIYTHNEEVDDFTIQGEPAKQYAGFTLETQTLPDAINQPGFGNIILRRGETYTSQTVYTFGTEE